MEYLQNIPIRNENERQSENTNDPCHNSDVFFNLLNIRSRTEGSITAELQRPDVVLHREFPSQKEQCRTNQIQPIRMTTPIIIPGLGQSATAIGDGRKCL
jgi:hypothetical protein